MDVLGASLSLRSAASLVTDNTRRRAAWVYVDLTSTPLTELRALAKTEVWGVDAALGRLNGIVIDPVLQRLEYLIVKTDDALRALPAAGAFCPQAGMIIADVCSPLLRLFPTLDDVVRQGRLRTLRTRN